MCIILNDICPCVIQWPVTFFWLLFFLFCLWTNPQLTLKHQTPYYPCTGFATNLFNWTVAHLRCQTDFIHLFILFMRALSERCEVQGRVTKIMAPRVRSSTHPSFAYPVFCLRPFISHLSFSWCLHFNNWFSFQTVVTTSLCRTWTSTAYWIPLLTCAC